PLARQLPDNEQRSLKEFLEDLFLKDQLGAVGYGAALRFRRVLVGVTRQYGLASKGGQHGETEETQHPGDIRRNGKTQS
ncbi:MAG: hypothetical protein ABIO65_03830, partial [Nitrospiria bacterium]